MDDTLGEVLRGLRHSTGQTLEEVAEATGISVAMLSRAERNQRIPSLDTVAALARHYGVPAEELEGHAIAQRSASRGGSDLSNRWAARNLIARSMADRAMPYMSEPSSRYAARMGWLADEGGGLADLASSFGPGTGAPSLDADTPQAVFARSVPAQAPTPAPASAFDRDALDDVARVAEVAIETALRAARRAQESGDPDLIDEAERVIVRLRRAMER